MGYKAVSFGGAEVGDTLGAKPGRLEGEVLRKYLSTRRLCQFVAGRAVGGARAKNTTYEPFFLSRRQRGHFRYNRSGSRSGGGYRASRLRCGENRGMAVSAMVPMPRKRAVLLRFHGRDARATSQRNRRVSGQPGLW